MRIESVEWNQHHIPPEELIDYWSIAADISAILNAVIRVKVVNDEDPPNPLNEIQP